MYFFQLNKCLIHFFLGFYLFRIPINLHKIFHHGGGGIKKMMDFRQQQFPQGFPGGGQGFPGGGGQGQQFGGGFFPGFPGGGFDNQINRLERQINRLENQLERLERRVQRIERRLGF